MLPAADEPARAGSAFRALASLVSDGRVRELLIARVDGEPAASSTWRSAIVDAGFVQGYRGLVLRAAPGSRR
jgi:ATP-dependent Lhr-like helicase